MSRTLTADEWLDWMENPDTHMGLADRGLAAFTIRKELERLRGRRVSRQPHLGRDSERRYESWLESLKDHGP